MSQRITTITPQDSRYPDYSRGVNQRHVGSPAAIYVPTDAGQLARLVEDLVDREVRFTVRSSGHCLEDFVYNGEVEAVIDLAQFNYVRYDQRASAFEIGAATPLLRLYEELYRKWGVTYPAGICYSVTPGGHVTGGGWGMLCRQLGLTIDYVCQIEVIWVDERGRTQKTIATSNPTDQHHALWWAHMGGGGGTFGVMTRLWLRKEGAPRGGNPETQLPSPPSHVLLSAVSFSWQDIDAARFEEVVNAYTNYFEAHAAPDDPNVALASFMVLTHSSAGEIALVTQVDATDPSRAQRLLDDYLQRFTRVMGTGKAVDKPLGELQAFQKLTNLVHAPLLPWLEATKKLATTNSNLTDPSYRQVYKSAYMRKGFNSEQITSLYASLTAPGSLTGASITFSSYGGQVNSVPSDATAYPHRGSAYKMMWMSLWTSPNEDGAYISWNRDCYEGLFRATGGVPIPNGHSDGCYVNYPDRDLNDPEHNRSEWSWAGLYWKENYPRLQNIKRTYDPLNVFHHRQSVRPT